ncbi:Grx4 family monothiol glutaredoxin [Edhazardia aedis USNM 41457]|uniref:Grx4 family monothiol glutaredoxin n=1 Tax=Edhazardia aedis (strain USNM 41457) TaxID=1003232 RepID=J8ZWY8_EDHAE|nr:Grx4 family monothiol glutaredoxin [Edhazardia aedis USNM 41457]|eukprot:EJW04188.1 Grx4 family monothiol glutaredoxin [Edhazardia aedis USNM 41457]
MSTRDHTKLFESLSTHRKVYFFNNNNPLTKEITLTADANDITVDLSIHPDLEEAVKSYYNIKSLPCIILNPSKKVFYTSNIDKNTLNMEDEQHSRNILDKILCDSKVTVFIKGTPHRPECGFTAKLIKILIDLNVKFDFFNIFEDDRVRNGLKIVNNWPTFPQIYFGKQFIGGLDVIEELKENGELDSMLVGIARNQ